MTPPPPPPPSPSLSQLLNALVVSGSPVLLEVLISVMCRESRHVHEDQIQASLTKFITE